MSTVPCPRSKKTVDKMKISCPRFLSTENLRNFEAAKTIKIQLASLLLRLFI